jgi:hypothetical protein
VDAINTDEENDGIAIFGGELHNDQLPSNEVLPEDCPKPWLSGTMECAGPKSNLPNSPCFKCVVRFRGKERFG